MMKPKFALTVALLAGLLAPALPAVTLAQGETPVGGPAANPPAKAQAPGATTMTNRVEEHIKQLHSQLKITPEQQSQWDQFAKVMRDNAQAMNQAIEQRGTALASMTAPENMVSYTQLAQQHAEDMQKLNTAFQTLYNSMSEAQKKNADEVFRARGERMQHQAVKH